MAIADIYLSSNGSPALSNSKVLGDNETSRIYFSMNFLVLITISSYAQTLKPFAPWVRLSERVLLYFYFSLNLNIKFHSLFFKITQKREIIFHNFDQSFSLIISDRKF